ncbi:hypothetical protein D9M68_893840 [compost metagenome]
MYRSHPARSTLRSRLQASRIASTSPCEVGSKFATEWLSPSPTTWPSFTTTAPKGSVPGASRALAESARARFMKVSWYIASFSLLLRTFRRSSPAGAMAG